MIKRIHRHTLFLISIITGVILAFDLFTIVTNLYVAPILEGFGLPDILIYMKTAIFLVLWIFFTVWLVDGRTKLNKANIKSLMIVGIVTIAAYFLSLYIYKYYLLVDTNYIIRYRILEGNPALALEYSRINYQTLKYVITVYAGFNSELILFAEAMIFQMGVYAIQRMETDEEPIVTYDHFMFDVKLFPMMALYVIAGFLSINILTMRYDMLGSVEMALAIAGFIAAAPGVGYAFKIYRSRTYECPRSFFMGTYRYLLIMAVLGIILFGALFGLNLYFIQLGRMTYRIASSFVALAVAVAIFLRVRKILAIENR